MALYLDAFLDRTLTIAVNARLLTISEYHSLQL